MRGDFLSFPQQREQESQRIFFFFLSLVLGGGCCCEKCGFSPSLLSSFWDIDSFLVHLTHTPATSKRFFRGFYLQVHGQLLLFWQIQTWQNQKETGTCHTLVLALSTGQGPPKPPGFQAGFWMWGQIPGAPHQLLWHHPDFFFPLSCLLCFKD